MFSPCKDCEKKGCGIYHSQCEKYLEFSANRQKINEEKYKESKATYYRDRNYKKKWERLKRR